jgi:hydroxyethylthiazole kinase-like uncharacterized protein yjeF
MEPLLTSEQMREVDRNTIQALGIPEIVLMEHAALAVVETLSCRFGRVLPETKGIVLAGPGNNGADALATVRLLHERGCHSIFVVLVEGGEPSQLSPLTTLQLGILGKLGIPWGKKLSKELLEASDWVIDGIFGTGLKRDLSPKTTKTIELLNQFAGSKWILSVDVPSGLSSDTGKPRGIAVKASQTVTLGFVKRGLVTAEGADYVGDLKLSPIQIPRLLPFAVDTFWYKKEDVSRLPLRKKTSHKGDFGHVWVVLGTEEKEGACILSSLGALKSGAGLVTVLGEKEALQKTRPRLPAEVMTDTLNARFFQEKEKGALVIGPGLGLSGWELLKQSFNSKLPLVVDADALTLIAEKGEEGRKLLRARAQFPTVMTPHPKEAARLLNTTVDDVEADRFSSVKKLAEKYECFVLLKGKGTCIRGPQGPTFVLVEGDSGLSKGGSGDLLSGVLAAQFLQGVSPQQAILLSVYLHGRASELLTQKTGSVRSSLPSEIANELTVAMGELES